MGNQFTTGTSAIYYRRIMIYRIIFLAYLALGQQDHPGDELEPAGNTRTRRRSPFPWNGCSKSKPCGVGQGDCDGDHECKAGLKCGLDNCKDFNARAHPLADCCVEGLVEEENPLKNVYPFINIHNNYAFDFMVVVRTTSAVNNYLVPARGTIQAPTNNRAVTMIAARKANPPTVTCQKVAPQRQNITIDPLNIKSCILREM